MKKRRKMEWKRRKKSEKEERRKYGVPRGPTFSWCTLSASS